MIHFYTILTYGGQTDGQIDRQTELLYQYHTLHGCAKAMRDKKTVKPAKYFLCTNFQINSVQQKYSNLLTDIICI